MLDRIVLHGEFSLFTVRGDFWYQIYRNRRKKVLCSRLSLITLTNMLHELRKVFCGFSHFILSVQRFSRNLVRIPRNPYWLGMSKG